MSRREKRVDSLLAQCVVAAGAAIARENVAAGRDPDRPASRLETFKVIGQAATLGGRVCAFVVLWANALDDLNVAELSTEQYARWAAEARSGVYRHRDEFRRCFPDHRDPNVIALELLHVARARGVKPSQNLALPNLVAA